MRGAIVFLIHRRRGPQKSSDKFFSEYLRKILQNALGEQIDVRVEKRRKITVALFPIMNAAAQREISLLVQTKHFLGIILMDTK